MEIILIDLKTGKVYDYNNFNKKRNRK